MIELICGYEPEHTHTFSDDWILGGPDETDPRSDPRWQPSVYVYLDDSLHVIHTTSVPICDDEAIDRFTEVARYGPGYSPTYLQVRRPGERTLQTLPWQYNKSTDVVRPFK